MTRFLLAPLLLALTAVASSRGEKESLAFLLLGDWGGEKDAEPTTVGERDCSRGMARVARELQADFVLGLGDNVYETGVHSWNEDRFQETFEDVFADGALDVDWYMVAGNHDHLGSVHRQIAYSSRSARWRFPALFYSFNRSLPSGKVAEFVMFDSTVLAGMSWHDRRNGSFVAAQGPEDEERARKWWRWLERTLARSKADYLFLASHYPVWSVCSHGPTAELVRKLRPLMREHAVTAHLAGHDHCLSHVEEDGLFFVLSGAGAQAWYKAENLGKIGSSARLKWHMSRGHNSQGFDGGFAAVTLTDVGATVSYHGNDGTKLFSAGPKPPRGVAAAGVRGEAVIAV